MKLIASFTISALLYKRHVYHYSTTTRTHRAHPPSLPPLVRLRQQQLFLLPGPWSQYAAVFPWPWRGQWFSGSVIPVECGTKYFIVHTLIIHDPQEEFTVQCPLDTINKKLDLGHITTKELGKSSFLDCARLLSIFETASTYLATVERFGTSLRSGNPKWHIVKRFFSRAHRSNAIPLG